MAGRALLTAPIERPPYPGAKPYLVIDNEVDNPTRLGELFLATERALPIPAPRKKPLDRRVGLKKIHAK